MKSNHWPISFHSSNLQDCLLCVMQRLTEKDRRAIIVQYKTSHPSLTNYSITKYFHQLGVSKSTVYSVLTSYAESGSINRRPGSGRTAVKMGPNRVRKMISHATTSVAPSQNALARKYGVSQQYIGKLLHQNGLRSFKKQKAPAVTEKQIPVQKIRIDRLYRHILAIPEEPQIVMDDEAYFPFSGNSMPENDHYYASSRGFAHGSLVYHRQAKFQEKIMVWLAVSPAGLSKPYFCPSREAVNAVTYQRKCIQQRLLPFLHLHHQDGQYLFWPDLASSHYAASTLRLLDQHNVKIVSKEMNPPNCPQLRPIEDFWGMLKQLVYANGWSAKSHEQLRRRIKYCLGKVDVKVVREMMTKVKSRIRQARAEGVNALVH